MHTNELLKSYSSSQIVHMDNSRFNTMIISTTFSYFYINQIIRTIQIGYVIQKYFIKF